MTCFNLKEGRVSEYKNFVNSNEAREMFDKLEKATGFRYVETYFDKSFCNVISHGSKNPVTSNLINSI